MIVFGLLGALAVLASTAANVASLVAPDSFIGTVTSASAAGPAWQRWAWIAVSPLWLAWRVLQVAAGNGLHKRRRRAIRRARLWAWGHIAMSVIGTAWSAVITPLVIQAQQQAQGTFAAPGAIVWGSMAFGMIFGLAVTLALPIILLAWLRRPEARAEYERWS